MQGRPPRQMHLSAQLMFTPAMHAIGSWAMPGNETLPQLTKLEFWQDVARMCEESYFDMAFFADHLAPDDVYRDGNRKLAIEYGVQFPVLDPLFLIPAMAAVTAHVGFAATMSTTYYPPFMLARKMATLDHVTDGRIGWNVVSSFAKTEMRAMGLTDFVPRDRRYAQAEEYLQICYRFWSSWAPDALRADPETMSLFDSSKVDYVTYKGEFFDVDGCLPVHASPQGRPVILQAGASPQGRDFAARHAEGIFSIRTTAAAMAEFADDIRARAVRQGRSPNDVKILFGAQLVQGRTDEEANERLVQLRESVNLEGALAKLSGRTGVDWAGHDLDAPLTQMDVPGVQGVLDMFTGRPEGEVPLTLRQAAIEFAVSSGSPQIVGSADTIADEMERLFVEGRGDGFLITPSVLPESFRHFADEVAPRLQKKGLLRSRYQGRSLRDLLFEDPN
jgi:FMN-dependent oxidoreductase (nitrilotriacetate monooxygenase family)